MTITIRPINTVEHCQYFQEIERRVWASEDLDIMPMHVLITVAKNGGVFLGAYASDGPAELEGLVGMTIGWYGIGTNHITGRQQLKFCSHMAGVLPTWQGRRIGLALKLAQRVAVLEQGLTEWITWTYDPLYRANAVFNIHRLGAVCDTYYPNHYGAMNDALNAGAPSDRCQVDWYLNSEHVVQAIEEDADTTHNAKRSEEKRQILPTTPSGDFRQPHAIDLRLDGAPLAIPLPDDISAMRRADQALGLTWRFYLRETLQKAFAAGYVMVDCIELLGQGWHYLLDNKRT
ncbi:GNAT family N-acetyltransferase [soil metagenome]